MLLAIDTSVGTSVAVVDRDAGILSEHSSDGTRQHAEHIGTFIDSCLRESGIAVTDLSGVVAGMGPGPFTGLRVGIAAARAFAFGAGLAVVPVVSHDAIAFGAFGPSEPQPIIVVTDARRNEVYWSAYSGLDAAGIPTRILGPSLADAGGLALAVPGFADYRLIAARTVSAASLGLLAEALFVTGRPFAADQALYLRSPDVTLSARAKRVTP